MKFYGYANCTIDSINSLLGLVPAWSAAYDERVTVRNYLLLPRKDEPGVAEKVISPARDADLFIYNPLGEKHYPINTAHVMRHLPPSCIRMSYPYLYNDAYSVDAGDMAQASTDENLANFEISTSENKEERNRYCISVIRKNETWCDIKVADFIESHPDVVMFHTRNHPTIVLLRHICREIIQRLGIEFDVEKLDLPYRQLYY